LTADVPEPRPQPHEALISVKTVSLNAGKTLSLREMFKPGDVPG